MLRTCSKVVLLAAIVAALPAHAQSAPARLPWHQAWTAELTTGVLAEPNTDGGAGGAIVLNLSHATSSGRWSPAILLMAARRGDIAPVTNGYVIDRDWAITAAGIDGHVVRKERLSVSLGAKAGVLWKYDRIQGVRGSPESQYGPTNWEKMAGLILDASAKYRIGPHVHLASRLGLVQHVFQDDPVGTSGGLASLGLAFTW